MTAELALGLPLLLARHGRARVAAGVGAAQVRVSTPPARPPGSPPGATDRGGTRVGRRIAPEGAGWHVRLAGDEVRAEAAARIDGPGGLFDFLPGGHGALEAVAAAEEAG